MEALTESLATSFAVSNEPNTTAAPHPRFSQYKQKPSSQDQEGRRKAMLEQQKSRRIDFMNHVRRLAENLWEEVEEQGEAMEESVEVDISLHKPGRYYKNQLMLSEWLVEVPVDLVEEWLMVICPVGKRCLVVASKGTTSAYGRNGYRINSFPSALPGGNKKQQKLKEYAILDCIYHEVEKTYFVLDIMCWKNHPVYDSETDFRFFWLKSRFEETPEATVASRFNPYKFVPLPCHPCSAEGITAALQETSHKVDGCLFYHKKACYTFGSTPLVVWLKPFMFQELLGLEVPSHMMEQKPAQYSTYPQYMQHLKELKEKNIAEQQNKQNKTPPAKGSGYRGGHRRKRGGKKRGEATMDVTSSGSVEVGSGEPATGTQEMEDQTVVAGS